MSRHCWNFNKKQCELFTEFELCCDIDFTLSFQSLPKWWFGWNLNIISGIYFSLPGRLALLLIVKTQNSHIWTEYIFSLCYLLGWLNNFLIFLLFGCLFNLKRGWSWKRYCVLFLFFFKRYTLEFSKSTDILKRIWPFLTLWWFQPF